MQWLGVIMKLAHAPLQDCCVTTDVFHRTCFPLYCHVPVVMGWLKVSTEPQGQTQRTHVGVSTG